MTLSSVSNHHSVVTKQKGKPSNTLGYSGNPKERYIINYHRNSVQQHSQLSFFRRLMGR